MSKSLEQMYFRIQIIWFYTSHVKKEMVRSLYYKAIEGTKCDFAINAWSLLFYAKSVDIVE